MVTDDLLRSMRKKYSDALVYVLGSIPKDDLAEMRSIDAISTGSLSVDICSGVGGIPRGRITELFGAESTGKSTLCLYLIANAQKQGLNVAYIDTEQSFDVTYAELCGVDINNLIVSQPDSLEMALNLTEDLIASGEFGLIVFDSVVGISPEKELEDELKDANVSLISKLMTKFCRRNSYGIRDSNVAVVFTNQVRDKIGAYIPSLETTGGHALKHHASIRIQTAKIRDIKGKDSRGEDTVTGTEFRATFKKNKVAPPFKTANFNIYFGKGIWKAEDVLTSALSYGIMSLRGSYVFYKGENIAQGKDSAMELLESNSELRDQIRAEILERIK